MGDPVRVLIMGAAGRDFHNFNTVYRQSPRYRVVAFTATQIPNIEGRRYPASLAGPLYPEGIPIYPEGELTDLIRRHAVQEVVFAYSDVSHLHVMHKASEALAAGADFRLLGPQSTCLTCRLPVVAVTAVRTGSGKSQTTRKVGELLEGMGVQVAVVRHPMPYGNLEKQAVQRFATLADLDAHQCTIEEREEYQHHIEAGHVVFAGVDYQRILAEAEAEAQILLWDGGNNDYPFFRPDLHITVLDPHRAGHETTYFPGEVNLRMGHVLILNKVDTAPPEAVERLRQSIAAVNPRAEVIEAASPIRVDHPDLITGKRVLVVEDGPTLTHGEMGFGAGYLAAQRHGASEILDPRPYAVGSLQRVYRDWPQLGPILPAMGYSDEQRDELRRTIESSPAEVVVVGTPIDLASVVRFDRPAVRVRYELEQRSGRPLKELLLPLVERASQPA
jgi:predicted GTPase